MNQHKIEIVGFGPGDLKSTLKPGWNPIVGKNGSGKSNCLAALLWALGGDVPVKLRHHAKEAYVEIDGVRIKTLSKPMLNIRDLELALRDESPISDVILPDVSDPKRAETKRIEALLRLVDIDVDQDAIATLVEEDEGALDYLAEQEPDIEKLSIVAAADKVRRRVHEIKRKWEGKADEAQGRINAVRIETPDDLVDTSVEDAQQAYDDAVRIHDRRSGEWSQRREREAERDDIRKNLGERPPVSAYEETAEDAERQLRKATDDVARLKAELQAAETSELGAKHGLTSARKLFEESKQEAALWDKRKAILASEITGASEESVELASRSVQQARVALSAARTSAEYREACQAVEEAQEERELALKRASRYEKLATSVTGRLSLLLTKAGIEKLTVEDGQLMYLHKDGEIEPFTDLSFGERTDAVIDLLARKKVPHDILVLPWAFHAALQPEAREEVGRRFAERGICAITEQPSDTEGLRVEHETASPAEEPEEKLRRTSK